MEVARQKKLRVWGAASCEHDATVLIVQRFLLFISDERVPQESLNRDETDSFFIIISFHLDMTQKLLIHGHFQNSRTSIDDIVHVHN